jgi:peptidylprolyl isomerase
LLKKLESLRAPDDVEAMQEIASTLGRLKDVRAIQALESQLDKSDQSVALAAAAALRAITGNDYRARTLTSYEPFYTDFDFKYLRALPETLRVKMETIRGDVTIDLYKNVAPFTVMSFLKLAEQRAFYRGLTFHRVVPNFVVQGGDPRGDGWGGPGYSIRSEFSSLTYQTGMLGIASAGKDTEGSQFFITQSPQPHLDGKYTIFGKVISGMEVVNKILVDDHIFDIKVVR